MAAPTLGGALKDAMPTSHRTSRRRNRSLIWASLAVAILICAYYARDPAVAVYHKTKDNWRPFRESWQLHPSKLLGLHHYDSHANTAPPAPVPTGPPIPPDQEVDHGQVRSRLPQWLSDLLEWEPPVWAWMHVPAYNGYNESDYDPNRWEAFPKNRVLFENNTVLNGSVSRPYRPYPEYNSEKWRKRWKGSYVPCDGLNGQPLNESSTEVAHVYDRRSHSGGPLISSFEATGLNGAVCFDRYSRLGPFGALDDGDVDRHKVELGDVQKKCLERNADRYERPDPPFQRPPRYIPPEGLMYKHPSTSQEPEHEHQEPQFQPRTAVLIRAWQDYRYEENDIHAIRSLASELSLQSGGEYQVFLFVMLKDWNDVEDHNMLNGALFWIPEELRDMVIFWSEDIGQKSYPNLGEWRVHEAQYLGVQWFMSHHPQFEYVWNWEMDARLIGHHYEFLERMVDFARRQPRKYLWERNARYYMPEVHGTWDEFYKDTNRAIEESRHTRPVWGEQYHTKVGPLGPAPPTSMVKDDFEWGVGEEADFISLLPIWDPRFSTWGWKRTMRGYHDDPADMPRRAYINTHARYSRRLLHAMHLENMEGRNMHAEIWPTSVALFHGLKAVYAPQPIWATHEWPTAYADVVFNADGWSAGAWHNASAPFDDEIDGNPPHPTSGRGVAYNETAARARLPQTGTGPTGEGALGRWGQERDSVYNTDREHNFFDLTWYYRCDGAPLIYWRWLGWKQTYSVFTMGWAAGYDDFPDVGTHKWEGENGRLCMPSMMLHPVKGVKRSEEELKEEAQVKEGIAKAEEEAAAVAAAAPP